MCILQKCNGFTALDLCRMLSAAVAWRQRVSCSGTQSPLMMDVEVDFRPSVISRVVQHLARLQGSASQGELVSLSIKRSWSTLAL